MFQAGFEPCSSPSLCVERCFQFTHPLSELGVSAPQLSEFQLSIHDTPAPRLCICLFEVSLGDYEGVARLSRW
jgi:hypothetical protein